MVSKPVERFMMTFIGGVVVTLGVVAAWRVTPALAAEATEKPTVAVCGVRVIGAGFKDGEDTEQQPFNTERGTAVAVLVKLPSGGLIAFDEAASKLATFADDKGGSLLNKKDSFGEGFAAWPRVSKDGKAAIVEVSGKGLPGKGSRELRVSGSLGFKTGTQKNTVSQKGVALKKGTKLDAGPVAITIKEAGKPQWGDEPLEVTFEMGKGGEAVAAVRFLDDQGKEIKSGESSSGSMTSDGAVVGVEKSYRLAKQVAVATVEITYWTDMKSVQIPFDLAVSMGLSQ